MGIFESIVSSSQLHITWALALFGGTVATIIGTSHISPNNLKAKLIYLLFIPSWILLSVSIWYGDLVSRNHLAAQFADKATQKEILREMNTNYFIQQQTLTYGVGCLAAWLVLYLIWWVFFRVNAKKRSDNETCYLCSDIDVFFNRGNRGLVK